ncbi:DUF3048 domain-containing protein [Kitasatospora sp. NBC_00240]|uniref:DUF3048 domain-containing protein n=1 Tax=Kitasatospora sp. NBC_00240 TaxID=2903567 RepID=UPI0022523AE2|nr:DUF3048 domain-containing protein [Kitasatospora sp. NBC_00240]MCX5208030.1 DUF3048 domain-containing protein [Kitasatospora sp. NBC_00240]
MKTFERVLAGWRSLPLAHRVGTVLLAGAAVALAVVLTLAGGRSPLPVDTVPPAVPAAPPGSPSPSGGPSPSVGPGTSGTAVSPLTGLPGGTGRIIAVKIDNIVNARPQTGLDAADVVYAIEVEGGISRFLAVYDSDHLPPGDTVGPVRSARESDLEILQQYGRAAFVYSGAQSRFLPVLDRADVFNRSPLQSDSFFRGTSRPAPYNEYVVPSGILRASPDAATARDIGFRFGDPPTGGVPADSFGARMPAASFTFNWSATAGRYLVALDGKPARTTDGGQLGAPTVVVQRVDERTSPLGLRDSAGHLVPFAPTVGSGEAVVLRDGRAYQGTWSRTGPDAGTTFSYAGQPMTFHPGQVWVVLEPR